MIYQDLTETGIKMFCCLVEVEGLACWTAFLRAARNCYIDDDCDLHEIIPTSMAHRNVGMLGCLDGCETNSEDDTLGETNCLFDIHT